MQSESTQKVLLSKADLTLEKALEVAQGTEAAADLSTRVTALQERYHEIFLESLGTITPFQAKQSVTPAAQPKFFKPRPVPYTLGEKVESKLDRLTQAGVLEKVPYSEWAATVVSVPKRDGGIRLCGDFKVTVNCVPL